MTLFPLAPLAWSVRAALAEYEERRDGIRSGSACASHYTYARLHRHMTETYKSCGETVPSDLKRRVRYQVGCDSTLERKVS